MNLFNKILLFIVGLLLGLILGGGTVWYLNGKSTRNIFVFQSDRSRQVNPTPAVVQPAPIPGISRHKVPEEASGNDEVVVEADSIPADSTVVPLEASEEIIVKTDQLLSTRSVAVSSPDEKGSRDTSLFVLAGVNPPPVAGNYTIEFWKSPINYRGYKHGRNKLILFGIDDSMPLALVRYDDILYLKIGEKVYRVEKGNTFRSFELIDDSNITGLFK